MRAAWLALPLLLVGSSLVASPPTASAPVVENGTGLNLPGLSGYVCRGLESALSGAAGPTGLRVVIHRIDETNGREYHTRAFGDGIRFRQPRTFVDGPVTLEVGGEIWRMDRSGAVTLDRRRFVGRTSAVLDYDPWLGTSRARRREAGFLLEPAALSPWGPLVAEAVANGLKASGLVPWIAGQGR